MAAGGVDIPFDQMGMAYPEWIQGDEREGVFEPFLLPTLYTNSPHYIGP